MSHSIARLITNTVLAIVILLGLQLLLSSAFNGSIKAWQTDGSGTPFNQLCPPYNGGDDPNQTAFFADWRPINGTVDVPEGGTATYNIDATIALCEGSGSIYDNLSDAYWGFSENSPHFSLSTMPIDFAYGGSGAVGDGNIGRPDGIVENILPVTINAGGLGVGQTRQLCFEWPVTATFYSGVTGNTIPISEPGTRPSCLTMRIVSSGAPAPGPAPVPVPGPNDVLVCTPSTTDGDAGQLISAAAYAADSGWSVPPNCPGSGPAPIPMTQVCASDGSTYYVTTADYNANPGAYVLPPCVAPVVIQGLTCSASVYPAGTIYVGQTFEIHASIYNPNADTATITSASVSGPGINSFTGHDAAAGGYNWAGAGSPAITAASSGSYTYSVSWDVNGTTGTAVCSTTVSITNPPPPTCSSWTIEEYVFVGGTSTPRLVVDNNGPINLLVSYAAYDGFGSSGAYTPSLTIAPHARGGLSGNAVTHATAGAQSYSWTVQWSMPGTSLSGTIYCSSPNVTIVAYPTCTATGGSYPVGDEPHEGAVMSTAIFNNPNPFDLSMDAASYARVDRRTAPALATETVNGNPYSAAVGPGNTTVSGQSAFVIWPGTYDANWTISYSIGYLSGTINCSEDFEITAVAPSCTVLPPLGGEVIDPTQYTRVEFSNTNNVPVSINGATYSYGSLISGAGIGLPMLVDQRSSQTVDSPTFILPSTPTDYTVVWTGLTSLGPILWTGSDTTCSAVARVYEKPIFKVYGGDVSAGGRFGTASGLEACSTTIPLTGSDFSGEILAYSGVNVGANTGWQGSSVQFGAKAKGNISGFYSASQRTSAPLPSLGLTFANQLVTVPSDPADQGGNFDALGHCIANYWAPAVEQGLSSATAASSSTSISSNSGDVITEYLNAAGGQVDIGAGAIAGRQSVFVLGDVRITQDIVTTNTTSWASRRDIPITYIIAKGNIYIDPAVSTIDAVLVAVPDDAGSSGTGEVYTCSRPSAGLHNYPGYTDCSNKLTINGAVVAKELHLGRVQGSLSYAAPLETPNNANRALDNIAEIINFTPELYLATPAHGPIRGSFNTSNSIQDLPPIL